MIKARVITRWKNVDTGETGTFVKRNGRMVFKSDRQDVTRMKRARVLISFQYFYGFVIDAVFNDDIGGPCPHVPLTSVEIQDEKSGVWIKYGTALRTTCFLKLRRAPGRGLKSSICGR